MKMIAFATLALLGLTIVGAAAPAVDVVGEAAAVQCDDVWIGEELRVNACEAVCAVGNKMGWHCVD